MAIQAPISGDNIREIQQEESRIAQEKVVALASAKAQLRKNQYTANSNAFLSIDEDIVINLNQVTMIQGKTVKFIDGSSVEAPEGYESLLGKLRDSTYIDLIEE